MDLFPLGAKSHYSPSTGRPCFRNHHLPCPASSPLILQFSSAWYISVGKYHPQFFKKVPFSLYYSLYFLLFQTSLQSSWQINGLSSHSNTSRSNTLIFHQSCWWADILSRDYHNLPDAVQWWPWKTSPHLIDSSMID